MKKRRTLYLVALIALLVGALAGCGATAVPASYTSSQGENTVQKEYLAPSDQAGSAGTETAPGEPAAERMIIWNAEISLTVKDAQQALDQAQALARQLGGYTVSTESWLTDDQLNARLTIRVPADKFEDAMAQLRALGIKVNRENATSDDVTDEYVDLGSRLRALEAKETQLLKFLDQAEDTEAVLKVYEQLSATQSEIEQVKGRMAYLEKLSAMATITAELLPEQAEPPVVEEGWKPLTTLRNAARALVSTLKGLGSALIWFVIYILPVLLILAVPVVLVWWIVRRLRRRSRKA
jgi:phage gp46-like protein